jgi:hypothetical protein
MALEQLMNATTSLSHWHQAAILPSTSVPSTSRASSSMAPSNGTSAAPSVGLLVAKCVRFDERTCAKIHSCFKWWYYTLAAALPPPSSPSLSTTPAATPPPPAAAAVLSSSAPPPAAAAATVGESKNVLDTPPLAAAATSSSYPLLNIDDVRASRRRIFDNWRSKSTVTTMEDRRIKPAPGRGAHAKSNTKKRAAIAAKKKAAAFSSSATNSSSPNEAKSDEDEDIGFISPDLGLGFTDLQLSMDELKKRQKEFRSYAQTNMTTPHQVIGGSNKSKVVFDMVNVTMFMGSSDIDLHYGLSPFQCFHQSVHPPIDVSCLVVIVLDTVHVDLSFFTTLNWVSIYRIAEICEK